MDKFEDICFVVPKILLLIQESVHLNKTLQCLNLLK